MGFTTECTFVALFSVRHGWAGLAEKTNSSGLFLLHVVVVLTRARSGHVLPDSGSVSGSLAPSDVVLAAAKPLFGIL